MIVNTNEQRVCECAVLKVGNRYYMCSEAILSSGLSHQYLYSTPTLKFEFHVDIHGGYPLYLNSNKPNLLYLYVLGNIHDLKLEYI